VADEALDRLVAAGVVDLVAAANPAPWFRDADVAAVLDLLDRKRSVFLVGPAGVGKTAVVHGVAAAMAARGDGALVELSTTTVMSGTKYLGEWETKVTAIAKDAVAAGAILFFTDAWNLPYAGRTSNSERNLLDALRPAIQGGQLVLLAEGPIEVLRHMERHPQFASLFHKHAIAPLPAEQVDAVVVHGGEARGTPLDAATRSTLINLTTRYLPARPQPGPALTLLDRCLDYQREKLGIGEEEPLSPAFVEKVFAIHSGLPMFVISPRETRRAEDIRAWFRDRIVGQQQAIEAVVETIALFKAGLCDPDKPIGTFLFVGPTGVGKTEVARALATFLFGSPSRLLRFDLSEFKDYHSFKQLIGDPGDAMSPARLIDPVRAQPFQVVLLDELEKAHPNVWDLLLPLLDEGRMTPPSGIPVDFRRTIVIATSNVGSEEAEKSVGFGASADLGTRRARIRERLEASFRPEFLNRFSHVVVFHPLDAAQVRQVARHELKRVLAREGVAGRNLVVEVADEALDLVIARGYDARWGARGLKRELQHQVVLPLAMVLMEHDVTAGQLLRVGVRDGRVSIRALDTDASREVRREREPVKVDGRKLDRAGVTAQIAAARSEVEALAAAVGEPKLREALSALITRREDPAFWRDPDAAALALRDLDRVRRVVDRVDRLRERATKLGSDLAEAKTRDLVERVAHRAVELRSHLVAARRELVTMGPDGHWDALVEIVPVGAVDARDALVRLYLDWAKLRGFAVDWLREPLTDDEPAWLAIRGHTAHGLLRGESGLHRIKHGDEHAVARVRVAPWTDDRTDAVDVIEHRALKRDGAHGRIRSRLAAVVAGVGIVLQNARTLGENRELALELGGSWARVPPSTDDVVRRVEPKTPMYRDHLAGVTAPHALTAERFDALLLARLDEPPSGESPV
jgi:ATP-dependent Clp protease ATP-binding subunit ClpC